MHPFKARSRISILREQAELTQLELSRVVGVTEATIANWEKGRSGLDWIERVARLCMMLDCTAQELLEYVPQDESGGDPGKVMSFTELQELIENHNLIGSRPLAPDIKGSKVE